MAKRNASRMRKKLAISEQRPLLADVHPRRRCGGHRTARRNRLDRGDYLRLLDEPERAEQMRQIK
jgi:hypothetical protein